MGAFSPAYDGVIELGIVPEDFTDRMARRVESGLLTPGSRRRADYVVRHHSSREISFGARSFWTANAIGLNEVELRRDGPHQIAYRGSFRRWARFAVLQGLLLGVVILGYSLLLPGARDQVASTPGGWPLLLGIVVFFGLVSPWLLIAFHRRVVARSLESIVRQVAANQPA